MVAAWMSFCYRTGFNKFLVSSKANVAKEGKGDKSVWPPWFYIFKKHDALSAPVFTAALFFLF